MEGNLKWIKELLDDGADINYCDRANNDNTALHLAAQRNEEKMVALLIDMHAQVNPMNGDQQTPLFLSSGSCTWLLLDAGAKTTTTDIEGKTALHYRISRCLCSIGTQSEMASNGLLNDVDLLIKHGSPINSKPYQCRSTPLHDAVHIGMTPVVEKLLAAGADTESTEKFYGKSCTPLEIAVERNDYDTVKILIEKGAAIEPRTLKGGFRSVLITAIMNRNGRQMVKLLIEAGADVSVRTTSNESALSIAVKNEKFRTALALLESGASTNGTDVQGWTPLHRALLSTCPGQGVMDAIVKRLCEHNIDVNAPSETLGEFYPAPGVQLWSVRPLSLAVATPSIDGLKALLEYGKPDYKLTSKIWCHEGWTRITPLCLSFCVGVWSQHYSMPRKPAHCIEVIERMLAYGAVLSKKESKRLEMEFTQRDEFITKKSPQFDIFRIWKEHAESQNFEFGPTMQEKIKSLEAESS